MRKEEGHEEEEGRARESIRDVVIRRGRRRKKVFTFFYFS